AAAAAALARRAAEKPQGAAARGRSAAKRAGAGLGQGRAEGGVRPRAAASAPDVSTAGEPARQAPAAAHLAASGPGGAGGQGGPGGAGAQAHAVETKLGVPEAGGSQRMKTLLERYPFLAGLTKSERDAISRWIEVDGLWGACFRLGLYKKCAQACAGSATCVPMNCFRSCLDFKNGDEAACTALTADQPGCSPAFQSKTWSTPGSYTFEIPEDVRRVNIAIYGAGGGGGSNCTITPAIGGGGGGGAYCGYPSYPVTPGQRLSISVGAGGSARSPACMTPSNGGAGGSSSVEGLIAGGGKGGAHTAAPGPGGVASGCPVISSGDPGEAGTAFHGSAHSGKAGGPDGGASVPEGAAGMLPGGGGGGGNSGGQGANGSVTITR
ncbi:MAG: hypothetical protein HY554_12695, partial [Elusimicrobia bacterium]|nr:hypothetical protein [Elusimicrobiota bacterium]